MTFSNTKIEITAANKNNASKILEINGTIVTNEFQCDNLVIQVTTPIKEHLKTIKPFLQKNGWTPTF